MIYTIGQAAKMMGVTVPTLRFYDKEGLLPFVEREPGGNRIFKEEDLDWLAVINCMKNAGAPKEIKEYVDLCLEGDQRLAERLNIFLRRKQEVARQMEELERLMENIDHKIWYYTTALEAGTESIHKDKCYPREDLLK